MATTGILRVIFARHGDYDRDTYELSAWGVEEAGEFARELEKNQVNDGKLIVLCSPRERAHETAKILAQHLQCRLQVSKFLDVDGSINVDRRLPRKDIEKFNPHRDFIKNLPIDSTTVIAVTHHPNIIPLSAIFGETRGTYTFAKNTTGAVGFKISAARWGDVTCEHMSAAEIIFERLCSQKEFTQPAF